jgi:hypothetical protein
MRIIHAPERQRCYECGERADVAIARGHRLWYSCWDHATALLEHGGVIVGSGLENRRQSGR